jgi:hypothetical protein
MPKETEEVDPEAGIDNTKMTHPDEFQHAQDLAAQPYEHPEGNVPGGIGNTEQMNPDFEAAKETAAANSYPNYDYPEGDAPGGMGNTERAHEAKEEEE